MNHVELKPYPFPEGVTIPRLMPYQEYPWNGDGYLAAEVLRLKEAHGLSFAVETGMCLGSTTCWLSEHFEMVTTCEVNEVFFKIGVLRTMRSGNVYPHLKESKHVVGLREPWVNEPSKRLYFLDAHWGDHCPLLDELDAIAKAGVKPCIIIHDFQVPGYREMGYDKMPDGTPFCYNMIEPYLIAIYGEDGFTTNYPTKVEGACRGWISIGPVSVP